MYDRGVTDSSPFSSEQEIALQKFVGLTEIMLKRQTQVEELGRQRRDAAKVLRDLDVPVSEMAKAAGIGVQAIYKLLSA